MKECDILGDKTYSDPSYIFSGDQESPNPQDLRPFYGNGLRLIPCLKHSLRTML